MRTNLPVTDHERHLKEGEYIVSTTDLKGRITFANRAFVEISGFTEAELIGQPHNLVRHPGCSRWLLHGFSVIARPAGAGTE